MRCEYCGNPDKERWQLHCMYEGLYDTREAFVASTFDPPCALDAYDEGQRVRDRRFNAVSLGAVACGFSLVVALGLMYAYFR